MKREADYEKKTDEVKRDRLKKGRETFKRETD